MSIPFAGPAIYSFITLCLKEQRNIIEEIAADKLKGHAGAEKHQETYHRDSFMAKQPNHWVFGRGGGPFPQNKQDPIF